MSRRLFQSRFLQLHFSHHTAQLTAQLHNVIIVFRFMGQKAGAAVLDPSRNVLKIPAALSAQSIQRAKAEQAIEPLRMLCGMAGKIFTRCVREEPIVAPFLFSVQGYDLLLDCREPIISFHFCLLAEGAHRLLFFPKKENGPTDASLSAVFVGLRCFHRSGLTACSLFPPWAAQPSWMLLRISSTRQGFPSRTVIITCP